GRGYQSSTTMRYSDQWAFGMNLDLQKLLNWQDAEFQMTVTDRNGRDLSSQIGDPRSGMLSSVQEVYGRGQTWRLTQFWLRQGLFDHILDIKAGRVTTGEDFDSMDSKFQNLAFGGGQVGNWRGDHWFNWPVSQWGGRVRLNFTPESYFQVGWYQQNPNNYERGNGFRLDFHPTKGNLVPIEFGWQPKWGPDKLPGNYRIGYYYSSANDNKYGSWSPDGYHDTDSVYGGYLLLQQQLTSMGGSADRGIGVTLQGQVNDRQTAKIDNYQSISLTWKGPFDARPQDEIGIGAARIHINSSYTQMQRDKNAAASLVDYHNPAYVPVQSGSEYDYEIYYNIQATQWLQIRPNLQLITTPGAVKQVDNAFVGGIAGNINF
ncbi:MAG: carbohydrate porin, partial [Enterobacteriaceae bacterium]